jgi:hypothetical protein
MVDTICWLIEVGKGPYYLGGFDKATGKPIATAQVSKATQFVSKRDADECLRANELRNSAGGKAVARAHGFAD